MINWRLAATWENWPIVFLMVLFWIAIGTLASEFLGAQPYTEER
jgi:hypothetical protein